MNLQEFKNTVSPILNDERYKAQRAVDDTFNARHNSAHQQNYYNQNLEKLEKMKNALRFLENLK